jgi:hypothetical protein
MASHSSLVHFAMVRSGLAAFAATTFFAVALRAADATSPVDYSDRNTPFAPTVSKAALPEKKAPAVNGHVQEKRVEKATVEKTLAPQGDRRAGIEMKETRDKHVVEKESHRPETREQATSAFNHRPAAITTSGDATKHPMVAKYQDSLTAMNGVKTTSLRAMSRETTAKVNRFVFRKNPPDTSIVTEDKTVTPAAGGAVISK